MIGDGYVVFLFVVLKNYRVDRNLCALRNKIVTFLVKI